jgi:iron(III) transport system substrate-binding protein
MAVPDRPRILLAVLALVLLVEIPPTRAADRVDIAAAQREGKIVLYTSAPVEIAQKLLQRFQDKYGIAGELFRSGGSAVLNRFQQELSAGHVGADILAVSDPAASAALAEKGVFVPFKPDGFDKVPDSLKDPQGSYVAQRVSVIASYGRSDLVPGMPQSWDALLDPSFRGKLVLTDPSFTALQLGVVAMLSRLKGWDYYEKLNRNAVLVVQSNEQALNMVKTGERPIAAGADSQYAREALAAGHKISIAFPSDGTFAIPASTSIVKGSSHPNAAKLFAEYMLSGETQSLFPQNGIYAARIDVAPPAGSPGLGDIKLIPMDFDYVEKASKVLKSRFNEIFQ